MWFVRKAMVYRFPNKLHNALTCLKPPRFFHNNKQSYFVNNSNATHLTQVIITKCFSVLITLYG